MCGRHALKNAERAIYTGRSVEASVKNKLAAHFVEVGADIRFGRVAQEWFLLTDETSRRRDVGSWT